jgi:ribonuclease-3
MNDAASERPKDDDERLRRAERVAGYTFRDRRLLLEALTQKSWLNEHPDDEVGDNERLEFLGDAVLSVVATERLVRGDEQAREGELTRRRAAYVSEPGLAGAAIPKGLGLLLRMGRGQRDSGGETQPSLVADAVEAVIGAAYLDGGLDAARTVVDSLLGELPDADVPQATDSKTALQELLQQEHKRPPTYNIERGGGPEHAPTFVAEVRLDDELLGRGEGRNKKLATRAAAADALARRGGGG